MEHSKYFILAKKSMRFWWWVSGFWSQFHGWPQKITFDGSDSPACEALTIPERLPFINNQIEVLCEFQLVLFGFDHEPFTLNADHPEVQKWSKNRREIKFQNFSQKCSELFSELPGIENISFWLFSDMVRSTLLAWSLFSSLRPAKTVSRLMSRNGLWRLTTFHWIKR